MRETEEGVKKLYLKGRLEINRCSHSCEHSAVLDVHCMEWEF